MERVYPAAVLLLIVLSSCASRDEPQKQAMITSSAAALVQHGESADDEVMENLSGQTGGGEDLPGAQLYTAHCADATVFPFPAHPTSPFWRCCLET